MEKSELERKLQELKEEYANTKYNKATDKHLGILRAKIAKISKALRSKKKGMELVLVLRSQATLQSRLLDFQTLASRHS
jgi:Predicted GTPase